jgi:hypothetical protein
MRALSPAMRMSQSSVRSKDPPMVQPFMATMMGAGMLKNCWVPRWPRSMKSRLLMSSVRTPIWLVSRPEEKDLPSPRQMMARTSGFWWSSARQFQSRASISSLAALCFSGRLLDMMATLPSYSRVISSLLMGSSLSGGSVAATTYPERTYSVSLLRGTRCRLSEPPGLVASGEDWRGQGMASQRIFGEEELRVAGLRSVDAWMKP